MKKKWWIVIGIVLILFLLYSVIWIKNHPDEISKVSGFKLFYKDYYNVDQINTKTEQDIKNKFNNTNEISVNELENKILK